MLIEQDPQYNVPREELKKKFPITYETPAETDLEKKVQERMLNGFNRWNMGYDAWEHWGEVLYTEDSIYHVHGVRFTLKEYQMAMNIGLKVVDMQMGAFENIILTDDWTAIRYNVHNKNLRTGEEHDAVTTEFVKFQDLGERGAKVVEGFGGIRGDMRDYMGMMHFQTPEEQADQKARMDAISAITLPETDDLDARYPILHPTALKSENAEAMKAAVLCEIDAFNKGRDSWNAYFDENATADGTFEFKTGTVSHDEMKDRIGGQIDDSQIVRIDNLLISADWAAVHCWSVTKDDAKTPYDHMNFYHFTEKDGKLVIDNMYRN